ncbi:nucleotidyl transferase AbiEii/AbiGii toxin family protein [uncultured Eubacterium sp.]|uniref:nucleotidyl transferase AbiEii/AbiGii toxin family protein n=1 Tax=uncultured Eubacterium sp. TaxID=165185 RepID=UPI00259A1C9B|nr:nucleotidyl transferase AbiEii/AbiGii toxin family protein [uncultured Eubacterium sp.]
MYLHEDNILFKELIEQVSEETNRTAVIIEKDYYVTLILRLLAKELPNVVFKGGTSLSKGYHAINRFSEDIDITFDEHISEARRKKLKRYSRHLYDIYKLTPRIIFDDNFKKLFIKIREHRNAMTICPSANPDINVSNIIRELCDSDFFNKS